MPVLCLIPGTAAPRHSRYRVRVFAETANSPSPPWWRETKGPVCLELLPSPGVAAVTQQIDLSGTVARMVASVVFGLAEIESGYRRERQAAGIAAAKERGVYRGRQGGTTTVPPRRAQELRGCGL